MAEAVVRLRVDASGATRALNGVQTKTNALQKSFGGLRTALAGIGLVAIARSAVKTATDFEKLNQRLKVLTKNNGTYGQSLKLAEDAQRKFGLSSIDALEGVTNLQARLGPLGSSMDEITAIFNGFNTAAILSGASTQEQAGAMRQLTQALGSGVLRGDEFNSISEQMSAVLKPIAKQLGVNVGALRDMAAQGKITKDVVVAAFKEIEKDGSQALKELIKNDPTMTFKILENETQKLSITVGSILAPAILDATEALTKIVVAIDEFIRSPIGQTATIFTGIAFAIKGTTVAVTALIAALKLAAFHINAVGTQALIAKGGFTGMQAASLLAAGGIGKVTLALGAMKIALATTGIGLLVVGLGALVTKIVEVTRKQKELTKALEEGDEAVLKGEFNRLFIKRQKLLQKLAKAQQNNNKRAEASLKRQLATNQENIDVIKDSLEKNKEKRGTLDEQNDELKEANRLTDVQRRHHEQIIDAVVQERDEQKKKNESFKNFIKDQENSQQLLQASIDGNFEQVKIQQEINALVAIHGEEQREVIEQYIKGTNELGKQAAEVESIREKFTEIKNEIKEGIVDQLADAITGAQSFGDAMNNVLEQIQQSLVEAGLENLVEVLTAAVSGANVDTGGLGGALGAIIGSFFGPVGGIIGSIFGGLFADGGKPPVGKVAVVGERGPELFVPKVAGTIIPNNEFNGGGGDNITNIVNVSVDASGSSVAGSNVEAQQLGAAIGAAIQAQLIKEKRSGGLLAR